MPSTYRQFETKQNSVRAYYTPKDYTKYKYYMSGRTIKLLLEVAEEIIVCDEMSGYGAGQSEEEMDLDWNTLKKNVELGPKCLS